MKKLGNIIVDKFTRIVDSRHNKRIAVAAVAVLLTAAVVTTSVFNRSSQAAENADTLMGIEKLRNQFSEEGAEYTILEIVPDINAAEIGYLFDGYEPILSKWDSETMTWKSWKDVLCSIPQKEDRIAFMEGDGTPENLGKKAELQAYYDAQGLKDNVPVVISKDAYDDSEEYKDGYEEVTADSYENTGYFYPSNEMSGEFYVSFTNAKQDGAVYYKVKTAQPINNNKSLADVLADGTYIYKLDGSIYTEVGTWGSIKDSIVFAEPNQDETDTGNKDDKNDDAGKETGNDDENSGNEDGGEGDSGDNGGNGSGDGGNDNGGSGNGEGSGDNGSGDGSGGNDSGDGGNDNGGNGNGESSNDNAGSNNDGSSSDNAGNGNGGSNNSANDNVNAGNGNNSNAGSNNSAVNTQSSTGGASKNSASNIKWLKFISADAPTNNNDGNNSENPASKPTSGEGQNNSSNNNSGSGSDNSGSANGGSENAGGSDNSGSDNGGNSANDGSNNSGDNDNGGSENAGGSDNGGSDNSGDNGNGGSDNSTDNGNGDSENSGDNGNGGSDNSGDNGNGDSENSGDNGNGNNGSDDNKDDGNSDDGKNDDDTDNNEDGDKEDNTGDDSDKKSEDEEPDKDVDKKPDKNNTTIHDVSTPQNENYYLVTFEREENPNSDDLYIVNKIVPAKYGRYGDEPADHPMGQYNFEPVKEGDNIQTYTFPGRVLYCKGIFHNNEWFKHYVINMANENFDNFKVKVITLTPKMLNDIYTNGTDEYAQGTIPDFNFLYLNSGLRTYKVDITGSADDDGGNTGGNDNTGGGTGTGGEEEPAPDGNEDNDNTGDNGDTDNDGNDNTGDNGNTDNDGNDNTGDNGNGDTDNGGNDNTGDNGNGDTNNGGNDNTGDNGNSDAGNGGNDNTGNNGSGDADNGGNNNTGNNSDADNSVDNNTGDNSENNSGSNSSNTDNAGNSSAGSNSSTENDSAETKSGTNNANINNSSYSGKSSLWKAFVATDDSSEEDAATDNDNNGGTSGDSDNNSGATAGNDNNDNNNNNDTTDNTGDVTDSTGTDDNTEGGENGDSTDNTDDGTTDDTDGDTTGDTENPDAADGEDGEDASSDSGNGNNDKGNTGSKSDSSIVLYSTADKSDLDNPVANLLYKTVSAKALPCLVDGSIIYGRAEGSGAIINSDANTENTEIFRLAAMLCQETLEKDYTGVSKENLLKGIVDDADKCFTTEQVYCRLGSETDSIINDNFFQYTIYKEGGDIEQGFQNVLDEIKLENLYRKSDTSGSYKPLSTNVAQAEAIRHILNYQNRRNVETKKSIKVLEIQPAYTTEAELTKEQLQKWAPGVEEVETTIMTTAEFIGKIDKINEIYDLVYIGTSKEHLNLSNWVTDTGKSSDGKYLGSTVFNDKDMDGLIYYNIGDKRVVYLPLSGLLDSEYKNGRTYYYNFTRYGGNDITKEKKDALISFLNGSYPIIVSDEFIEQPVTVFEDDNFAGRRVTLDVGDYKEQDLLDNQVYAAANTPAKGISSIQVKKGYQITLFDKDNFEGNSITIKEDTKLLTSLRVGNTGQTWNNRCRSAIIKKIEDENVQTVKAIDGNHIDNSSYLYEFVNTALEKKYDNFYAEGDIDENGSELLKFYLNRPKATLVDFTTSGIKGNSLDGSAGVNDAYYIYPNTVGKYTLQYNFTIKNEGAASMDTRYYCKLYIDVNADGKFSEFEEVSDIVMTNRSSGGHVSSNELYASVPYTIIREVPTGYKGLLPWKVEVCQVDNENIYASEQGYTKLNGLDKEVLKICQITKEGNDVINLHDEIETEGRYFNILVYGGDYGGVHYPGITSDFELEVTTITIPEYEENYTNNNDYLADFNMLILGFSDMYGDFTGDSESGAMGAIVDFINSGKSVLMAHDTTSFFNNPIVDGGELGYTERNLNNLAGYNNDTRFSATLNKYVRPLVGMDRYGVLSSNVVKKGVSVHEGSPDYTSLINSGKDVAYKPKSGRKETVPEAQGYTYSTITAKDKRHDGNDGNIEYTRNSVNLDANLDSFSNSYASQRFDDCYYWDNGGDNYGRDNGEMELVNNGEVWQAHVTQVNEGQITEYPYRLEDEFEVGLTHAQYYQLDYTADDDGDGQSDLVVWYCLGGRTSNSGKSETIYSQSPNDVRNNYYIYNKGNITYTGMGHASKNDRSWAVWYTFDEAKLFINTMIASYQAGVKPPTVTVLDSGSPDASQLTTMYRYYDNQHMISITDAADQEEYEKVYFTVRDLNFVKGSRVIATHAYYYIDGVTGEEEISVNGEKIPVNHLDDNMYSAANDMPVDANNLISGENYYILVPKSVISQCDNGLDIYFEAQSTITTNTTSQNVYTTDKVYAKLQVLRAYLFELD